MADNAQDRAKPFWTYEDLALFLSAILPSLLLATLMFRLVRRIAPGRLASAAAAGLTFQLFLYVFLLWALYLLIAFRYRKPFWRSMGWTLRFRGALLSLAAGPLLAIATSVLGVALRTPEISNPILKMISDQTSLTIVIAFGVLAAPFFEEIFFRGFILPLLSRSFGAWAGIILTAIPFALLHGAQNQWVWQQITLIFLAGVVFGVARYKTGSTAAAFLIHASFNATQFLGYLLTRS